MRCMASSMVPKTHNYNSFDKFIKKHKIARKNEN